MTQITQTVVVSKMSREYLEEFKIWKYFIFGLS